MVKGQLSELKQMMRVSFDLQLDIQRAIRQEVAAALMAFLSQQQPLVGGAHPVPVTCPVPTLGEVAIQSDEVPIQGCEILQFLQSKLVGPPQLLGRVVVLGYMWWNQDTVSSARKV